MKYKIFNDYYVINTKEKAMQINGKSISFTRLEEINQATKHDNVIYKPMILQLYIAYKNNKLGKFKDYLIN